MPNYDIASNELVEHTLLSKGEAQVTLNTLSAPIENTMSLQDTAFGLVTEGALLVIYRYFSM